MLSAWLAAALPMHGGFGGLRAATPAHNASALAAAGIQLCPIHIDLHGDADRDANSGGPVELTLVNDQMLNLELLYVMPGDTERRYWVVDARGEFRIGTRESDRWRLRMKSGELAAEIVVGSAAVQRATISECLPPAQEQAALDAWALRSPPPPPSELARCDPWSHLSSEPSPGMHVLCVAAAEEAEGLVLSIFAHGWVQGADAASRPPPSHSVRVPQSRFAATRTAAGGWGSPWGGGDGETELGMVATLVMELLRTPTRGPRHQQPALFSPWGVRLNSLEQLRALDPPCAYLFEGGVWIWPGIEVGHVRELDVHDGDADQHVTLRTLSLFPRVLLASDFLTAEEAELIMAGAEGHMFKSGVSLKAADLGKASSDYRTSSQWSFPMWDSRILNLDRRVQQLTRIPITHAEQIQVLRYLPNEHYTAHHDFFDPGEYAGNEREAGYARNRLATVFFYLNEPTEGGQTGFPRAGKLEQPRDFLDCSRGVAVKPQRLAVLIFYSMLPNGEFDQTSLHAGCDVKEGVKWAANFWFWNQPQQRSRGAEQMAALLGSNGTSGLRWRTPLQPAARAAAR